MRRCSKMHGLADFTGFRHYSNFQTWSQEHKKIEFWRREWCERSQKLKTPAILVSTTPFYPSIPAPSCPTKRPPPFRTPTRSSPPSPRTWSSPSTRWQPRSSTVRIRTTFSTYVLHFECPWTRVLVGDWLMNLCQSPFWKAWFLIGQGFCKFFNRTKSFLKILFFV